jgi:uncharacterized membrane protein YcaP (DUF421 family)
MPRSAPIDPDPPHGACHFDLVVAVALGSTLTTVLLTKDVALAEGIVAFGLLVLLQYAITCSSVRSDRVRALVKAEPCLLLGDG